MTGVLLINLLSVTSDRDIRFIRVTGKLPWHSLVPFKKGWISRLLTDLPTL